MTQFLTALLSQPVHAPAPSCAAPGGDAFHTSGPSPTATALTLHLLGLGKVGRALLRQLDARVRVVGVTDSSGTAYRAEGFAPAALLALKARGDGVAVLGGERLPLPLAVQLVRADVVVDCLPTEPAAAEAALARVRVAHAAGRRLVLAGKAALAHGGAALLERFPGLGVHAALGGTGRALRQDLAVLRARCAAIACVPNATTTTVIDAIERGGTLGDGIAAARGAGLLEADPALDLDGVDAALKLAIVAGWVFGGTVPHATLSGPRLGELDPTLLRARRRRGATTRLVGRATRAGAVALAFVELPPGAPLAVPPGRVAYGYHLDDGALRLHVGAGVGPEGSAAALGADLHAEAGAAVRS